MAGVPTAIKSHDMSIVPIFAKVMGNLSLGFVSMLQANNNICDHF
jgi:hypothetical protein